MARRRRPRPPRRTAGSPPDSGEGSVRAGRADVARAFAQWAEMMATDPGRFAEEPGDPEDYGEACATLLITILGGRI